MLEAHVCFCSATVWCNVVLCRGKGWVTPWAVHLQHAWSESRSERRSVEWLPPLMPAEPHSLERGHSGSLQLLNKQRERKLWDRCRMLKVRDAIETIICSERNQHWGLCEDWSLMSLQALPLLNLSVFKSYSQTLVGSQDEKRSWIHSAFSHVF